MTKRINHAAEARRALENIHHDHLTSNGDALAWAQVHATLALVAEQRIANLIAYVAKWTDGEVLHIDAEIRKGLGL